MTSKSNENVTAASGSEHLAAGKFNDTQVCDIELAKAQLPISNTDRDAIEDIIAKIKTSYERKLSETLNMHDEMVRKYAELQVDFERLQDYSNDLQSELKQKTKDLEAAELNALIYETQLYDIRNTNLQLQFDQSQAETNKMLARQNRESKEEIDRLQALLNVSQSQKIFELNVLRDRSKEQMRANREEIKLHYENKIKNMAKKLQKKRKPICFIELEKPEWTKIELQSEILENIIQELKGKGEQYVRMKVKISDAPKLLKSTELPKFQIDIKCLRDDNGDFKSKLSSSSSSSSDDSDESSSDESWTQLSWPPIISSSSSWSSLSPPSSPTPSSSTIY